MKKYIDFNFVDFQKELLSKSPLNLIVNPNFPTFRLFEVEDERYGKIYSYERNGNASPSICRNLEMAIKELKKSFISEMELDNNSLGAQKADLIEDLLIKKYPDYGFYCPYDISNGMGVEVQIIKYIEEIDEDGETFTWNPSIWITQNEPVAFRYLTNFMPFDMAMDIVQTITRVCQSKISLTYKGKELYCYENGVAV